ncbi:MAG: hypothetical protein LBS18_03325 [Clostridiales bacterium]|nr:hypothetical protein [Clostridiales bacterium]
MQTNETTLFYELSCRAQLPPDFSGLKLVLAALGLPETKTPAVHIAGTNGKGSIAHMVAAALISAGYKTGLFISPHIIRFEERVQVNGTYIDTAALRTYFLRLCAAERRANVRLNYFSAITCMAFLHFQHTGCDIMVLETGLGGRLDPTNSIPVPQAAVLAQIGVDHAAILGDTVEKITFEKAGIIKPGGDVVLQAQDAAVEHTLSQICKNRGARLHIARAAPPVGMAPGLKGAYQLKNAATAYKTLAVLNTKGFVVPHEAVRLGLADANWPARFELLHENPPILLDGAHNPAAALALGESIQLAYPDTRCVFIAAFMRDKEYMGCLRALSPLADIWIASALQDARALPAEKLKACCGKICKRVYAEDTLTDAMKLALRLHEGRRLICVFGSLYMAKEVKDFVTQRLKRIRTHNKIYVL